MSGVRRISWGGLPLDVVILDGPIVSGALPEELRGFPIIGSQLRSDLFRKYHFRNDHPVTVADVYDRSIAENFANDVRLLDRRLRAAAPISRDLLDAYSRYNVSPDNGGIWQSPRLTVSDRLVKDVYNSFAISNRRDRLPTILRSNHVHDITVANIVSELISGRDLLPKDQPVTVHLALDVSYSMKRRGRIPHGLAALNRLARSIPAVMPATRFVAYTFSESARRVALPVERVVMPAENTCQRELFRTVLRSRESSRHNVLVLISDGEPSDLSDSIQLAGRLKQAEFDYVQILLHTDEDLRHEVNTEGGRYAIRDNMIAEESVDESVIVTVDEKTVIQRRESRFDGFTRIAEAAGGNQVVLTEFSALGLLTVELYDRYVGLLSLV